MGRFKINYRWSLGKTLHIFTNLLILTLLFSPNLFKMTGIIRLIDQAAYQQMAIIWQTLQKTSVTSLD